MIFPVPESGPGVSLLALTAGSPVSSWIWQLPLLSGKCNTLRKLDIE